MNTQPNLKRRKWEAAPTACSVCSVLTTYLHWLWGRRVLRQHLGSVLTGCRSTVWTLLSPSASHNDNFLAVWFFFFHISLHFHTYSSMKEWSSYMSICAFISLDSWCWCGYLFDFFSLFCDLIHRLCDGTQFCLVWAYYRVCCVSLCTKPSNDTKGLLFSQEVHSVWTQTTLSRHFIGLLLILKPLCLAEKPHYTDDIE